MSKARGGAIITIGKIVRPHGIKGEIKVEPLIVEPEQFQEFSSLSIKRRAENSEWMVVEQARIQGKRIILKLSGIEDRDQAESIRGLFLQIHKKDCPLPKAEEMSTLGLEARTVDDEQIGTVVDVLNLPAQKVFVIKSRDREILVPDVEAFIKSIDLENGIIVIDPIEGLLD